MSGSTSSLDLISASQSSKEVTANALFDAMSQAAMFGRRESTSSGLVWGYYGGCKMVGEKPTIIANGTVTLTNSATNYVYEVDGVVAKVTAAPTGWPGAISSIANARALYEVVVSGGVPTSWIDYRCVPSLSGPRIATPASAAAITCDFDNYDIYRITMAHNITFTFQGGSDGAVKLLELKQDATGSRVPVWPGTARFSASLPAPTLTTTANRLDKLAFRRRVADTKYDIESINLNFT